MLFSEIKNVILCQHREMEQLVARRAHNPKVVGSSPALATRKDNTKCIVFFILYNKRNARLALIRQMADVGSSPALATKKKVTHSVTFFSFSSQELVIFLSIQY